jgi:hypothetical protein
MLFGCVCWLTKAVPGLRVDEVSKCEFTFEAAK